jgi:hypothetical protein
VHGTSAALGHSTAEFGAGQMRDITQDPEERHVRRDIQFLILTIDVEGQHGEVPQTHGVLKGVAVTVDCLRAPLGYPFS